MLTQLRTADTDLSIGEARFHRYQLNPCLTEDEVQAFERRSNVILPDDYRQFLLQFGNGGAGPGYGMLKLLSKNQDCSHLGKPFPYESPADILLENGELEFDGTLPLADYGCGMVALLVITGKEWGKVWLTGDEGISSLGKKWCGSVHASLDRELEAEEAFSFSEWYRDWLVNSLARLGVNG